MFRRIDSHESQKRSRVELLDSLVPRDVSFPLVYDHKTVRHSEATVSVAIYKVFDERDPNHWPIYVQGATDESSVVLQVEGENGGRGYYVADAMYDSEPESASSHEKSVEVGFFDLANIKTVGATIQATPVDNESTTWNCQVWIMEALDNLQQKSLFTWNSSGKTTVMARRQIWQ